MAVDSNLLKGEVEESPTTEDGQVEKLIIGFLKALLDEQGTGK